MGRFMQEEWDLGVIPGTPATPLEVGILPYP